MKKSIFLVLIFIFMCINVSAIAPEKIKIGLFYNQTALDIVTITYDGKTVTLNKQDVTADVVITSTEIIKVNDKGYRGSIIVKKIDGGGLTVINEVGIEDYVASVIAREMSPSFNMEALKAQAVCARTYATYNINKHIKYGFDLCTTEDCQVYFGASSEHKNTIRATIETKGQILTYNGEPAQTVYFATSGGYTEDVKYVWGSNIPYLQSVKDENESKSVYASTWKKELSRQKATEILNGKGYNIGNVKTIEVLEKTTAGSVTKLKITGDKGEKTFTNEGCRTVFGYGILLSQAYSVTGGGSFGANLSVYGGSVNTSNLTLLSANGKTTHNADFIQLKGKDVLKIYTPCASDIFTFNGRGNGHLVGMSQNGANGMAAAGFTYEQILTHYYKGTKLL